MRTLASIFIASTLMAIPLAATAQIPHTLSYQGILTDSTGTPKPDGTYNFTFRLYAVPSGGSAIWGETKSAVVKRGLFSTILGSLSPIPDSVRFTQQYWLGIQVASDPELSPRMQLSSVGSSINSLRADVAQTVPDGSIGEGKIASGQVVKSINNLHDHLTMQRANGASVTSNGDTITITASGGGGGGISTIQNTDNALGITNPGGPTTTINLHSPFTLNSKVGIGTTTPNHRLRISGGPPWTSNGWLGELEFDNASAMAWHANASGNRFGIGQTIGGLYFFATNSDPGTTGSPANYVMTLADNANVGIGTTTPDQRLTVGGATSADTKIKVDAGGDTYAGLQLKNSTRRWNWQVVPSNDIPGGRLRLTEEVANAEWMTITGAGNVGIGVINPTLAKLLVDGGGGTAVYGQSAGSYGLLGYSTLGTGVGGHGVSSYGVAAYSENNDGLVAQTNHSDHAALFAQNLTGTAFAYLGTRNNGVEAHSASEGPGGNAAIYGFATRLGDYAGHFVGFTLVEGPFSVFGDLYVAGDKNFMIDHPLDPANKTLTHSCIESNERLLMYSGTVTTDANGDAGVNLPSYFEALNTNYRYQLTVVGQFAQAIVAERIHDNRFGVKTDKPNVEVSWLVIGDRNDAYSKAHPYVVEEDKKPEDRGKYLTPELFGQPAEMRIGYHPTSVPHVIDRAQLKEK